MNSVVVLLERGVVYRQKHEENMMSQDNSEYIPNVSGKYWVDQDLCLAHGCCPYEAPENFIKDQVFGDVARVYKQPETLEEERQCQEAIACCPVAAIHDDGETNPEASKYVA